MTDKQKNAVLPDGWLRDQADRCRRAAGSLPDALRATVTEKVLGGRPGARWAFLEGFDIGIEGDPYLDRLRIIQTPLFGFYLHHIHRPDRDRDPHDHPWSFLSVIIAGSYREKIWPDKRDPQKYITRNRKRWSPGRLRRGSAHIITSMNGPLWTLVLTGPRRGEWGFWTDGSFVPWREYISSPSVRQYRLGEEAASDT